MKPNARCIVVALSFAWLLSTSVSHAALPESIEQDTSGVYRVQPSVDEGVQMVRVSGDEIVAGLVYNYYNEHLGRRAWGLARDDGTFQYALGEGSTLSTDKFDFHIAEVERTQILEIVSPGLERALNITGRTPSVQLDASGEWSLLHQPSIDRVFDLETGHRWEWHGKRRLAVLHTHGDRWRIVDGDYEPADNILITCPGDPLARAGSADFVIRTAP